jgi:hypothetical protein
MIKDNCKTFFVSLNIFLLVCLFISDIIFYINLMFVKCSVELNNNMLNNLIKYILKHSVATSISAYILIWLNSASFILTDNLLEMNKYMNIFLNFTFLTRILLNLSMVYIYYHKICNNFTILFQNFWFGVVGGIIYHLSIIYFIHNLNNTRRNFQTSQNELTDIEIV